MFLFIMTVVVLHKVEVLKREKVSSLLLYNIEALAADEYDRPRYCFGIGSIDCPTFCKKVEYYGIGFSLEVP